MLARREPITLRSLVQGTGVSTMAVYTYFGNMTGLWSAVRQEGFTRLGARLAELPASRDPVRDLVSLGAAYVTHALAHPHLYRTMFDDAFPLEDPAAAVETFDILIGGASRAVQARRLDENTDALALATEYWIIGHGLCSLAIAGVLPAEDIANHARSLVTALFVSAGDDPARCRRSFSRGWQPSSGSPVDAVYA